MLRPSLALLLLTLSFAHAAQPALTPGSSIDVILDALHARGQGLKDFTADVSLAETDALSGDTTTLLGKVYFQQAAPGENARMRVSFDSKKIGQRIDKQSRTEYLLDKGVLIERDYRRKLEVDRQVLKPGQKMNLLKLGEGPFPLPIGQERAEVLRLFDVRKLDPKPEDPPQTLHIQLTPKPKSQFARKFKTIDVWVETATSFPRRIETSDVQERTLRTTDLAGIQVNAGVQDKQFVLEPVEGWNRRSEVLED